MVKDGWNCLQAGPSDSIGKKIGYCPSLCHCLLNQPFLPCILSSLFWLDFCTWFLLWPDTAITLIRAFHRSDPGHDIKDKVLWNKERVRGKLDPARASYCYFPTVVHGSEMLNSPPTAWRFEHVATRWKGRVAGSDASVVYLFSFAQWRKKRVFLKCHLFQDCLYTVLAWSSVFGRKKQRKGLLMWFESCIWKSCILIHFVKIFQGKLFSLFSSVKEVAISM